MNAALVTSALRKALAVAGLSGGAELDVDFVLDAFATRPCLAVDETTLPQLAMAGIRVEGGYGPGNVVLYDPDSPYDVTLHYNGQGGNIVALGRHQHLCADLSFEGEGHVAALSDSRTLQIIKAIFHCRGAALCLARDCYIMDATFVIEGPGSTVAVGRRCLLSWGSHFRTSDSHAIIDLDSGKRINLPQPLVLGPHVWVGQEALVLSGLTIGQGAIIGARAVVTRDVAPCSLAAGVPARVLRENVSWTLSLEPTAEDIARTRRFRPTD